MNKLTKVAIAVILVIGAVIGILAGVGVFSSSSSASEKSTPNKDNALSSDSSTSPTPVSSGTTPSTTINANGTVSVLREGHPDRPASCKIVPPGKRVAVFWMTEIAGCDTVPDGVTHVYFAFAEIAGGLVNQTFQTSDANVTACITSLRKRCILALGSVGGANANKYMKTITNSKAFADSAMALVKKFKFDGLDIDDESVGPEFDGKRVLGYMKELYTAMKADGNNYLLTYDTFMYEGNLATCAQATYIRCWPVGLEKYVDWVNVMAYNINNDPVAANNQYVAATKPGQIFSQWAELVTPAKLAIGTCSKGGDAYGPCPSDAVVSAWTKWAEDYGGMMVWAASKDVAYGYQFIKNIITSQ
ncbi:carbohydrate-binding protein [Achlya hypogyna]|uniref:Carbohydrate-binding protein n=1 Tax=Achlya hypogyna TaxID=1202772 RepID=A0A1V9Z8P0_ACHHY|nr:carbohydrate-binding protein [Achlya hypogyna]